MHLPGDEDPGLLLKHEVEEVPGQEEHAHHQRGRGLGVLEVYTQ